MYQNYFQQPYQNPYQFRPNRLPPQHALRANGKESIDSLMMSPDSDVVIVDSIAPRVWFCVSDGLGNVKATPYKVIPETGENKPLELEERLSKIEETLLGLEDKINESYVKQPESKQTIIEYPTSQGFNEYG